MSQNTNDIREVKSDGNVLSTSESNAASAWKETEAKAGETENNAGTFTEKKSEPAGLEEQSNEEIINTPASQESEMIGTGPEDPQKEETEAESVKPEETGPEDPQKEKSEPKGDVAGQPKPEEPQKKETEAESVRPEVTGAEDPQKEESEPEGDVADQPKPEEPQNKEIKAEDSRKEETSAEKEEENPKQEVRTDSPKRRNWFVRFLLCGLSFALVCGLIHLVYFALKLEPFGTDAVSIDDAKIQYIDFFTYYVDVLRGTRTLNYDFGNMLGGSSIGLFSYYLASPFNLLLYFFGKKGVYRFFNIAVALKLGTAGATFCWYLQRRFEDRIRPALVIALSMGYGLMQYSVAQSSNIMWLDGVYMLPLMLLGVYEVIHRKSIWRLVLATAFCILCNWYIGGLNCLFSGIWFLFEFIFCERPEEKREIIVEHNYPARGGYSREEAPGFMVGITDFILSSCRYFWAMGLGVAGSAILFLPAVSAMRQGKGQYEEVKILMEFTGDLLSAVRGYFIGSVSDKGYAALFCGGIAVFAAAALFFSGSIKLRQKIAFVFMMGVCFLMLQWEPAMMAFSLLKRADSYWYRYSYLVCFAMLFGAGAYLSRAEKDRWSKVFVILSSLLYAAALLKLNGIHFVDFRAQGIGLVLVNPAVFATAAASLILAVLTVILLSAKKNVLIRLIAGLLVILITGAELGTNAWMFWRDHKDGSQTLYMEYSQGLKAQLKQLRKIDGGYYRIAQDRTRWHYDEDDLTSYFNESLAQNYWSNAAYTSSPENAQLSLMWRLGYRDEAGCMLIVRDSILASDSFLGVKYLLESTPVRGLKRVKNVKPFNGRSVYLNPYALPMAFVYDGSKLPSRRYENAYVYQNALFSTLSGRQTELYTQLSWTRRNEGDKSYFRIFVPEGNYLAYGNLLWPEKMGGLMSINGAEPFGYCRWQSPASFMIRSRKEQAASQAGESLQAVAAREKEEQEMLEAAAAESASSEGAVENAPEEPTGILGRLQAFFEGDEKVSGEEEVPEVDQVQIRKDELVKAAAAFDRKTLAEAKKDKDFTGDVRTIVFSTEKGLTFKDYQFYGLNLDVLAETSERIRAGEVKDIKIKNGRITCSVQGTQGRSICLLVPWSKGWKALRNNEIIQPDTVAGTMITIPLVDGANKIELTYEIPFLREGMYISAAALAVMLIDALCRWISTRKKKKNERQVR